MTLSVEDGKLFYELMWKLLYYVNQKRGFYKDVASWDEYAAFPAEKKLKVRDALWKNTELIETYVQENPDVLSDDELAIIRKWRGFIKDSFFILRHLKKGSIFIGKDNRVYAVHGIQSPLDEVIPSYALPQMAETILLPFKGQIIYDGLLSGYSVHFGGGIRSDLNHTYIVAKNKNRVITTLEPDLAIPVIAKPRKNIAPQLKEVSEALAKIKGDGPLQKSALALAQTSIEVSLVEVDGTLADDAIGKQARKIFKASKRLLDLLDIMEDE